jgi:hypothetical protein
VSGRPLDSGDAALSLCGAFLVKSEFGNRNCPPSIRVRAEIAEGRSEKDEQNKIAADFLRSYSQT